MRPSSRALRRERLAWQAMYGGIYASHDDIEPGVKPEVRDVWLKDCVTGTTKTILVCTVRLHETGDKKLMNLHSLQPLMLDYDTAKSNEAEVALLIRMPVSEVAHDQNATTLGPIEFGVSRIVGQVSLAVPDAIA